MEAVQEFPGKIIVTVKTALHRAYTAVTLIFLIRNWYEVALGWLRRKEEGPNLVFRRGMTIGGALHEDALQGFDSVFRNRDYRRFIQEPQAGELIDIGANIGALSLDWLSRKPGVRVHAYEPNPRTFAVLKRNIDQNGVGDRAYLYNEAVWNAPGTLLLHHDRESSVATTAFPISKPVAEAFSVKSVGLDEVVGRCVPGMKIGLVKIDVEGAEAEILEGSAGATLARINQIVLEYHDFRVPGTLARCRRVLEDNGFFCSTRPSGEECGLLYAIKKSSGQQCR